MRLVPAVAEDWERAWALQREAFDTLVQRTWGGWTDAQQRRSRERWAPEQTSLILDEGELVGWLRLERHADHDWLNLLVIGPPWQRRGLGTRVLRSLLAEAQARGVPLWLSVYRTNPARSWYLRHGFVEWPRDGLRVLMGAPAGPELRPPAGEGPREVIFVSGHLDLSDAEFVAFYEPVLRAAMSRGAGFVVGDARGTDARAQAFMAEYEGGTVVVYHMFERPRHRLGPFAMVGGFSTDDERDAAMTAASTADLAWVRPGREQSGTARNLARRTGIV